LGKANDIPRRAFDAVAAVERPNSLEALQAVVTPHFAQLGVEIVAGGVHDNNGTGVSLFFGDLDHRWTRHYLDNRWHARSPVASIAARTPGPVFWSDVKQGAPSADARRLFAEAGEFDMHDGHVMMLGRGAWGAMLVATASSRDLHDADSRLAIHLLSLHYALVGFDLWRNKQPSSVVELPRLTARQIECLKWTRDGKSSWEIGAILSLSSRTVEEHLNKACARLGVRTRMQAVVEAGRLGIISL